MGKLERKQGWRGRAKKRERRERQETETWNGKTVWDISQEMW